ncbi:protein yhdU [Salmonella enterica subsp. arizonae]|uniref:Protein yhdU n=1 Tax=Salmonella enterica subsp. arizonae TaxID=59203 RepID=A0A379SPB3_SALER|nr:protein yhdU [Salmonella enterica subsp. arizonae]
MIRKYWWLVVFAVSVFLFDTLLMQWIELMATEQDKCRNMDSVNPLKLINCTTWGSEPGDLTYDYLSPGSPLSLIKSGH